MEITRTNASRGMQYLWQATDDALMGLGSIGVPRGALRLLTFTVCSAPNVATALTRYHEFQAAFPGMPAINIDQSDTTATLSIELAAFDPCSVTLVSVGLLVAAHRVINWATRRPLTLYRVELPHPQPTTHAGYPFMFGAPTVFDAPRPALVFNADALTRAFSRTHDDIEGFLSDIPGHLLAECDLHPSISHQVRSIIEDRLGTPCTTDDVAAAVGMSRATLWRRLHEENTSVSQIRDQVLHDTALTSLARGDQTIAQLSQRLGFSEPSAFTRAFRRWTGHPPSTHQTRPHGSGVRQ